MIIIDGKKALSQKKIKQFIDLCTDEDYILLMYTNTQNDTVQELCTKSDIIGKLFCEEVRDSVDAKTVITAATEKVTLELVQSDVNWYLEPTRFNKINSFTNSVNVSVRTASVKPATEKASTKTSTVTPTQARHVAIGCYVSDEEIVDIESAIYYAGQSKDATAWINTKIEEYFIAKRFELFRICTTYDENSESNVWCTVDELREKGIIK